MRHVFVFLLDESMFRPVYGCPLQDHLRVNDREIAFVIEECCLYLLDNALEIEVNFSYRFFAGSLRIAHYVKRVVNAISDTL